MIDSTLLKPVFLGLMSGTSLDGIDVVAVDFSGKKLRLLGHHFLAYPEELREELLGLSAPGANEIERAGKVSLTLAKLYAQATLELLDAYDISRDIIEALGVHGQTVRHRPNEGWSLQLNAPALVAELTGLDVVADFRSRDLAAGGEGAPLVPGFHAALFSSNTVARAIVNLGGIANVTLLPPRNKHYLRASGFDCGPANVLLDAWANKHLGKPFDENGAWAATGTVNTTLLEKLLSHPYFAKPAPKSTGREDFNLAWLESLTEGINPADVERTLISLTAKTVALACKKAPEVYLCGGGTKNALLFKEIQNELSPTSEVFSTEVLGVDPMHVEAMAFAWLARGFYLRRPGNLCEATHAAGRRVLGALYPH